MNGERKVAVCPWAFCVIAMTYQNLKGGKGEMHMALINKKREINIWSFPSNIICKGLQRETHLTLPISYCLSVFLIWSDVGQLPFWARSQDTYWQGDWQLIKLAGIHFPRFFLTAFIYNISILLLWIYHRSIKVHLSFSCPHS